MKDQEMKTEGSGKESKAHRRSPFGALRENLEAIIVAVVLALIIRHFSVEAFEIPTGSMAPTLYGIHCWVRCPNCDTDFNIGLGTNQATGEFLIRHEERLVYRGACPKCKLPHHRIYGDEGGPGGRSEVRFGDSFTCPVDGTRWQGEERDFSREDVFPEHTLTCPICWFQYREVIPFGWFHRTGGHKILVDKFAYKIGKPERWDVIVFQFDRETNYIKRLVGKPGESVELKGGDLYIDGKIERKFTRPDIQEVLWTKVGDLDIPERGYQKIPAWKEVFPPGSGIPSGTVRWDPQARRFSVNTAQGGAGRTSALLYGRPIRNYYTYNLLSPASFDRQVVPYGPMGSQVGDKKVTFTARIPKGARGWIGAEMRDGSFAFQARIPLGAASPKSPAVLRRVPGQEDPEHPRPDVQALPLPEADGDSRTEAEIALPADAAVRVEFENVDDRVALRIGGKEVLWFPYKGGAEVPDEKENNIFLLAGDGAACDLESIQVYRDIFYTDNRTSASVSAPMRFAANGSPVHLKADGLSNEYMACGDNSPSSSDSRFWGPVPEGNLMGKALLVFWPIWKPKFIR